MLRVNRKLCIAHANTIGYCDQIMLTIF
jgi:hypothetical protein